MKLKEKYMDILMRMNSGFNDTSIYYSGYLKDIEGEDVYLFFGSVPFHNDAMYFHHVIFEFIVASTLVKLKNEDPGNKDLSVAIKSFLERNKTARIVLENTSTTPFVNIRGLRGKYPDYINFYYKDLALMVTGAFNSLSNLINELKGEPTIMDDENIFDCKKKTVMLDFNTLEFDDKVFLKHYKHLLEQFVDGHEHYEMNEIMYLSTRGIENEELDEEEKKAREKINDMRTLAEAEYQLVSLALGKL